ncbi:spore cortex biosynthesis protein YabQ [Neomoorella thermoacetica]|uniref:Spore cortex protein YabQ n=1 Tax=Neomoorella thermoacetica TaxID=1525 RepID=A0A1J5JL45_NEOTH|nr:spore cortex biosynthesis protein YabQ [Moorella thermoacetica]OIQ10274.1 spore cortex protein YabQ [Moorella thermoacetica]OIQ11955.1 spore cortex protein YabQ [Moorella thermoacetica]
MIPVLDQWQIFLALAGAGMVLAFAFDCYRVGRYFWRPRSLATMVGDALFWLLFTLLTFILLMLINWGEVRAYTFLALVLGALLYGLFLSRGTRRCLYAGGRILGSALALGRRLLNRTVLVVLLPGRLALNFLAWPRKTMQFIWSRWLRPGGPGGSAGG